MAISRSQHTESIDIINLLQIFVLPSEGLLTVSPIAICPKRAFVCQHILVPLQLLTRQTSSNMGRISIFRISVAAITAMLLSLILTSRLNSTPHIGPTDHPDLYHSSRTRTSDNELTGEPADLADLFDTRSVSIRTDTWNKAVSEANTFIDAWISGCFPKLNWAFSDLEKWAWVHDPEEVSFNVDPVRAVFHDLGLSIRTPPNLKKSWHQRDERAVDGGHYKA